MHDEAKTTEQLLAEIENLRRESNRYKVLALELKRTEERLLQLEKAVDTMPLGVTITDLDGTISYTNPADAAMHGYEVQELQGKNVRIFAPPDLCQPRSLRQIKQWQGLRRESVNVRKDGTHFPVWLMSEVVKNVGGDPCAIVTSCEDITVRKQMELALRESEEQYRALFESLQDVFYRTDPEGHILLTSPSLIRLLGYAQEEALRMNLGRDILANPEQWQALVATLEKDGELENFEVLLKCCNGSMVWGSMSSQWYTDKAGRVLGIEGMIRDISDRKKTEAELQKFRETWEQLMKERSADAV